MPGTFRDRRRAPFARLKPSPPPVWPRRFAEDGTPGSWLLLLPPSRRGRPAARVPRDGRAFGLSPAQAHRVISVPARGLGLKRVHLLFERRLASLIDLHQ